MAIIDEEALSKRADDLEDEGLNGLKLVLVDDLLPAGSPTEAILEVHFHNANELENIRIRGNHPAGHSDRIEPKDIFPITGGHRVRGGAAAGQVQVTGVQAVADDDNALLLTVQPIGDYSTYTLGVQFDNMDPVFDEIAFKFRPGCFSTDCAPERGPSHPSVPQPHIDYLAKDYESFRHALMVAMRQRVPGWEPTSEADFTQVLIDLLSAAGDELSDYQDRVTNEAYLSSARNRVSLARHARLMDYHIHQGNQASTWLALRLADGKDFELPAGFEAWTDGETANESIARFLSRDPQVMYSGLDEVRLHTWSDTHLGLAAGATEADLFMPDEATAERVSELIRDGTVGHLLIQEHRHPHTGGETGADPNKRQLLKLVGNDEAPVAKQDPLTDEWHVHVRWRDEDRLEHDYCFNSRGKGPDRDGLSLFHGNLVRVYQGQKVEAVFREPDQVGVGEFAYERTGRSKRLGVVVALPADRPLLYQNTLVLPRGRTKPASTLQIAVELPSDGIEEDWTEVISLVHSQDGNSDFAVETDELGRSVVRFGNGTNGRELPDGAVVRCSYQTGFGPDGNVGADRLALFDRDAHTRVAACWNSFDVTDGRAPEPRDEIVRNVPEAYRAYQLRAVTLADYVNRAEEVAGVSRAAAHYAWTGSWRTVRVTIDAAGTETLSDALRRRVARHLETVRLIGEDLEIRAPRFVPLTIVLRICAHADVWPETVRFELEEAFSDGYTSDGSRGFFHSDRWTFGQLLHRSQIIGRAQTVSGVERVIEVTVQRWNDPTPGSAQVIDIGHNEIIQVRNDPDHMELGSITFDIRGGRQ